MDMKARDRLRNKGAQKSAENGSLNGRDIYEVKEQLGGQEVPWDNNSKMQSKIFKFLVFEVEQS